MSNLILITHMKPAHVANPVSPAKNFPPDRQGRTKDDLANAQGMKAHHLGAGVQHLKGRLASKTQRTDLRACQD